jgi:hypothetical protein
MQGHEGEAPAAGSKNHPEHANDGPHPTRNVGELKARGLRRAVVVDPAVASDPGKPMTEVRRRLSCVFPLT